MKHILIMEDNAAIAFDWRDTFNDNGFKVTLCRYGEDGIAVLRAKKFDLVVTDLFATGQHNNGYHVVGEILTWGPEHPPIIAVTGAGRHKDSATEES